MSKLFEPGSPLEEAIHRGDTKRVDELLDALDAAGRSALRATVARCARLMSKARFTYGDKNFAGWGRQVDDAQCRAVTAAAVACGCAGEVAEVCGPVEQLLSLGKKYGSVGLDSLAEALLDRHWRINDVQRLIEAGLVARPVSESYYIGLMNLIARNRYDNRDIHARLAADPGLRDALLRMLDVEGNAENSLANFDKYLGKKGNSWAATFLGLIERGVYTRAQLIDKCLGTLERGWIQYRSGWFSGFLQRLEPTVAEMTPHASRYLGLLGSRIPPTVTFALDPVAELADAGVIGANALLPSLAPVFTSAVKGHIETALKTLDRAVKREPALAQQAAQLAVRALGHESAQVQKQVLKRLADWDDGATTRESLAAYASGIAAVNRASFDALSGVARTATPKAAKAAAAQPPAAPPRGLRQPLDPEFAVTPIESLDELIERVAYVFVNDTDSDEFERAIAGLVRFAPFTDDTRKRFAAVAKRVTRVRKPVALQLARLLHALMTGEVFETPRTQTFCGHPNFLARHLAARIEELMKFAPAARGNLPLATPTHRRGFVDPAELVRRLAAMQAREVPINKLDLAGALMRLAPPLDSQALSAARKLADDDASRALRMALGDDARPHDAELAAVGRRMRKTLAGHEPSPRAWRVETRKFEHGAHELLEVAPSGWEDSQDPVARLEAEAASISASGWYEFGAVGSEDEGSVCHYATLLPADMENFCAEGVALLSRNVDWWQAHWEHKAYLRALLHPTVPMRPMSTLLLAIGLACKEPGEMAVSVDLLVQSFAEGRLDAKLLARDVAELLRTERTACARYARSLRAALRIEAALAPVLAGVLCDAVIARPSDPPKDTAALLELLLEIVVANELTLPGETRDALESMQIGGKGKALRQQLLARK